ncbi:hypothetical protein BRADI_5g26944v3 [Brachypodium distachyon]|uniref:Uncharacterized protein n=1 Tax=Brachypodium distachyon TaxID=15368 RepID=A0A0Q3KZC4_BRADI|nr:hypothetical protein BRADI_5g26944v3 [Brachypodium distachyon]
MDALVGNGRETLRPFGNTRHRSPHCSLSLLPLFSLPTAIPLPPTINLTTDGNLAADATPTGRKRCITTTSVASHNCFIYSVMSALYLGVLVEVAEEGSNRRERGRPTNIGHFHDEVSPTHFCKVLIATELGLLPLLDAFMPYLGPGPREDRPQDDHWLQLGQSSQRMWMENPVRIRGGQHLPLLTISRLGTSSSSRSSVLQCGHLRLHLR